MSEKLKPCLFCKEKKEVSACRYRGDYWKVDCLMCGASGPKAKTEDEAIKKWNQGEMSKDGGHNTVVKDAKSRAKRHMAAGLNDIEHYMASCSELSVEKATLQAENKDLQFLVDDNHTANRAYEAENKRLRDFLAEWDGHSTECEQYDEGSPRTGCCTCGYEEAKEQALKDTND